jgi:hypothetical protein
MGDGVRLAVAILILFIAMVAFFFAFHPGGVQGVSDPATMLQWLMKQWDTTTAEPGSSTGKEATGTTQAPGTTTAAGRG